MTQHVTTEIPDDSWSKGHPKQPTSHQTRKLAKLPKSHLQQNNKSLSSKQTRINLHLLPKHIILLTFTILLTCIAPTVSAKGLYIPEQMVETPSNLAPVPPKTPEDPRSALSRLAKSGPILIDLSPPPQKDPKSNDWVLASLEDDLRRRRRQVGGDDGPTSTAKASSTTRATPAATTLKSTTASPSASSSKTSSVMAAEETGSAPLPKIFDSGFNGNLTDSCQTFMDNMLADATFKACLPVSLLLTTSTSFFQTMRSVLRTTRLLDFTCAANPNVCTPLFNNLVANLTLSSTCGSDYRLGNPQIRQAEAGLLAYRPLYTASCLRNQHTSSYCFADAVTNTSSPSDGYIYWIPLNNSMPVDATPTCGSCLKDTMAVFSSAEAGGKDGKGANKALGFTYSPAAHLINVQCGPGFVNTSLAIAVAAGSSPRAVPSWIGLFTTAVMLAVWMI